MDLTLHNYNFSLVSAVTPDYVPKLEWCLPTWTIKPQFKNKKLYLFHHGFDNAKEKLNWVLEYFPNTKMIYWDMEKYENQRELMLSVFVLGSSKYVTEEYFCKLDADTYFTDSQNVFKKKDFQWDLFSHRWGYTKPAWWINKLDAFVNKTEWSGDKSNIGSKGHKRIQSVCCLHKTEFVQYAAKLAGDRLPVPSHDTYLWYLAEHLSDRSWDSRRLFKYGVGHNSRLRSIREGVCGHQSAWNPKLNKELTKNIQIHITDGCNIGCNNCDRCCGVAKSSEHMSVDQIRYFIKELEDQKHKVNRLDIIGGEPLIHPDLLEIVQILKEYKSNHKRCKIRLSTNGTVNTDLFLKMPDCINIRNSAKKENKKDYKFEAFNVAPIDLEIAPSDVQSCSIPWRCGVALTRYGYFLCGAGYGVARVFGFDIGIQSLKECTPDRFYQQKKILCQYCGHSRSIAKRIEGQKNSPTWEFMIQQYKKNKPKLTKYSLE